MQIAEMFMVILVAMVGGNVIDSHPLAGFVAMLGSLLFGVALLERKEKAEAGEQSAGKHSK